MYPPDAQKPSTEDTAKLLDAIQLPVRVRSRRERLLSILLAVALVLLALAMLRITTRVENNTSGLKVTDQNATDAKVAVGTAKRKVDGAARVAKQANSRSIGTKRYLQGKAGLNGAPGRNGIGTRGPGGLPGKPGADATDAQVNQAVARYCDMHTCGSPPTSDQVLAAVTDCAQAGACRGPGGIDGQDGTDGKDAPPVTDAQISDRVDAYCQQRNQCAGRDGAQGLPGGQGPQGLPGDTGPQGAQGDPAPPPGPSIATSTITESDGTVHVCTATKPSEDVTC